MHTTFQSTLTTQKCRLGYWAFCELPNLNNIYGVSAHLQLVPGLLPRCQNGQVWRGLPIPIYHRGYRNSTAIPLLPL